MRRINEVTDRVCDDVFWVIDNKNSVAMYHFAEWSVD